MSDPMYVYVAGPLSDLPPQYLANVARMTKVSRSLAEAGHYPAIDVEQSISRAMHGITSEPQQQLTRRLKQLMASYQRNRDLINVGAYRAGSDPQIDMAIAMHARIEKFLQQDVQERAGIEQSLRELSALFN